MKFTDTIWLYRAVSVLLIILGIILGQGFLPELGFSVSDLITLSVSFVTFWFAYKTINNNRAQILLSNRPYIDKRLNFSSRDSVFYWSITNVGTGTAINMEWYFYLREQPAGIGQFEQELKRILKKHDCDKDKVKHMKSFQRTLAPLESHNFYELELPFDSDELYKEIQALMTQITFKINCESLLNQKFQFTISTRH